MWAVMQKMNFPEGFIQCIKKLYKNASSKININGNLTREFEIKCSVRQGCPLSMGLFVLCIEPIIQKLSKQLKGVCIQKEKIKVLAYADDIAFIARNMDEIDKAMETFEFFNRIAGAKLNKGKTSYLRLNSSFIGPQIIREETQIKILGKIVHRKIKIMCEKNFSMLFSKIKYLIMRQNPRNLCLIQRVWIINTFLLSKLWYIAQVLLFNQKDMAKIKRLSDIYFGEGNSTKYQDLSFISLLTKAV